MQSMRTARSCARITATFTAAISAISLVMGLGIGGCIERDTARLGPTTGVGQRVVVGGDGVTDVDLLFVLDNSQSMRAETARLRDQIPRLVEDLVSPPLVDGEPAWPAVQSLRIGVVTSDVGIGYEAPERGCTTFGDEARFVIAPEAGVEQGIQSWSSDPEEHPGFLTDPAAFVARVSAVVDVVIDRIESGGGCGFEQQLEAAAMVIEDSDNDFPREDAMLVVVVVSDEDDCSAESPQSFFMDALSGPYNAYCAMQSNADRLQTVQSLADRLLRGRSPRDFLFAAITGVPDSAADLTPAEIAELDEMVPTEFTSASGTLFTNRVCGDLESPDSLATEGANPGLRYTRLATVIPDSLITSICADDFGPAILELTERIGDKIGGVCLLRALQDRGAGVDCRVEVTLPEGERCQSYPGYRFLEMDTGGLKEVCLIDQAINGEGEGYTYLEPDDRCVHGRLELTQEAPSGAEVRAECFLAELFTLGEPCARGPQCETGYCSADRICAEAPTSGPSTGF